MTFNPDNRVGMIWYIDGSKTNNGIDAGVYRWGSGREHSFSLGLHITIFHTEKYTI
jgi:hypothetical protein